MEQRAKEDELFAVSYAKANKSIDECCNYILYESYAEAAGAFLQESDYIPTQMETQNSIMKKRTGEVRLPSDHKMKK